MSLTPFASHRLKIVSSPQIIIYIGSKFCWFWCLNGQRLILILDNSINFRTNFGSVLNSMVVVPGVFACLTDTTFISKKT